MFWLIGLIALTAIVILLIRSQREKIRANSFYKKIRPFFWEMMNGLLSVRKVKNKTVFFLLTFLIWAMYYLMSYVVVFSMKETASLGPLAGLVILTAGGLGMTAPVQGGIGTYHALVSNALVLYGISYSDGVIFATLLHSSQFIFFVITGSIGLIISSIVGRKQKQHDTDNP
jgi:uncharacterized membrane protein YbhN (UPF0104 family)